MKTGKIKTVASKNQKYFRTARNLQCPKCQKFLTSQAHFVNHLATHNPKDFICDICGRHFNSKDKLRLHMFNHRIYYKIKCAVCDKEYRTNQSMRKHLRTHFEQHQCDECGQVFKHKKLLQNHISSLHRFDPSIPCNYCTRLFPSTTTRDSHQKTIHSDHQRNTQHFKCPDCPQGFEMKEELRIHTFIHFDGEIHTCTECHQIFKKKKLLMYHMSKHFSPNYRCDQCQKLFKYRSNLGKHLRERRCKPFILAEPLMKKFAEEAAEIAKQQFINMTVNPTRLNVTMKKEIKKQTEKLQKKREKEFVVVEFVNDTKEPLADDTYDIFSPDDLAISRKIEESTSQLNIEKEEEKPIKRAYIKKKPMKTMKKSAIPYECDLCEFNCEKKCQILSHIRHHISSIRHKCLKCLETFSTRMRLHFHSMKAHGRGVIGSAEYSKASSECPICNQLFSEERIKFHMKLHDALTFKCIECEKVFRSEAAAEKHFMNSHGNEKRFTCATCGKSFGKLTILKQHEEIHNPIKIYVQCEICSTMMLVKSLKLHMAMKHSDRYKEKRHVCDCGKAFRYAKQLEKHCNSVHMKESRGFVYPCPECEEVFNRRQELREHSFVHYSGKIFQCDCGMKFKKRKLLTIHEGVHKDLKFPCDFCSLTFQTRGGRRKHHSKVHGQIIEEVLEIPSFEAINANHYDVEFQK